MAEQVPQADPGHMGEMQSAAEVSCFSVFPSSWPSLTNEEAMATGHAQKVKGRLANGIQIHKY